MTPDFDSLWADLADVGRSASTGGYFRQPFGSAERECAAWFLQQAAIRELDVRRDGFGNVVAWWPTTPGSPVADGVLTGSHLDSVLDGGAFDGPLGVISAFAALDLLRERDHQLGRPLGIGVFVEEEGSRFGRACLGSGLATGAVTVEEALGLRDRAGIPLGDVWEHAGLDPSTGSDLLAGVGCFVELHVEQGRELVHRNAAIGLASEIWPHGRYRFDFTGEANHAGSTRMEDRHDPMLTYANTVLAGAKAARLAGARATFGRVEVGPNSTNAVPSRVTGWLDARATSGTELDELVSEVTRRGTERAGRDGTSLTVTAESVSAAVRFPGDLAARLAGPHRRPVIATQAGHDAGALAASGIPTAMLFVRNPTGVSHSPAEHAETDDCLAGVVALADALAELTR